MSGTYYWLAIWSNLRSTSAGVYCQPSGGTTRWTNALTYGSWPNPITTTGGSSYVYSIYAQGSSSPGNQAPTVSITAPANNATFTAPATVTINATAADADGTVANVQFFSGTTLLGTDTTSPYTYSWSNVSANSYSLTAKATDNSGASTTSLAVNITVNTSGNQPPTITTQPASRTVQEGQTAAFGVVATGTGTLSYRWQRASSGSSSWVDISGTNSASYTTPACQMSDNGASFRCVVSNSYGNVTSSEATLTVTNTPTVGIGSQSEGTTTDTISDGSGTYINATRFQATASMTLGSIRAKVLGITGNYKCAIYSDSNGTPQALLAQTAEVTNPATGWQTFTLSTPLPVVSGTYYWLAIWSNLTSTSAGVYCQPSGGTTRWTNALTYGLWPNPITTTGGSSYVYSIYAQGSSTPGNQAPTVSITAPASGSTYTAPASVTIQATAGDIDGTVTSVAFYNGSALLGTDTSGPSYTYEWTNVGAGNYRLTARATDNGGATTISSAISITVNGTSGAAFGNTSEGTATDGLYDSGAWINASRFSAASTMTVSVIRAKVAAISGRYKCAIYTDNNGSPGTLLGDTLEITNPAEGCKPWISGPVSL